MTSTVFSTSGIDQHVSVNLSGPLAGQIQTALSPPTFTVQNLRQDAPVSMTKTSGFGGESVATFQPASPLADGWYESHVHSDALDDSPSDYQQSFSFLNADFTGDRVVNFNDFLRLQTHYGQSSGTDEDGNVVVVKFSDGDADYNGTVDFNDYLYLQTAYGHTLPNLPTRPGDVAVANTADNALDVGWAASATGVRDGFKIYRSDDGGATYNVVQTLPDPAARAWRDSGEDLQAGLETGKKYWYRVRAYTIAGGASTSVMKASGVPMQSMPTATGLAAAGVGPGRIRLRWTPPANTAVASYKIYRSQSPTALPSASTLVATVDSSRTRLTDSGLSPGHTYYYRIVTVGPVGLSLPSLPASARAQTEGPGIGNGGTPFDPATHDSDNDGTVDVVDTDNDNDGTVDEQDDDGDGISDPSDPDDDNDGVNDDEDASTAGVDVVPSGAGSWTIYHNGGVPSYVRFEASNLVPAEILSSEDPLPPPLVPKMSFVENETQTFKFTNLPKHAIVSIDASIIGGGFETEGTPDQLGHMVVKIGGTEIQPWVAYGGWYGNRFAYDMGVASEGTDATITFTATDLVGGNGWYFDRLKVIVFTPTVSVSVDKSAIDEDGVSPDSEDGTAPDKTVKFMVHRNGPTVGDLTVGLDWSGTAGSEDASGRSGSVTIPDGSESAEVKVTIKDDPDAEGVETLILKAKDGNGKYRPSTTSATLAIDDNVSIKSIEVTQQQWREGSEGAPNHNAYGYYFEDVVKITGEHLDKVSCTQLIRSKTEVWNYNGNFLTEAQTYSALSGSPAHPTDPNIINSGGMYLQDTGFSYSPISSQDLSENNGVGFVYDQQAFHVPIKKSVTSIGIIDEGQAASRTLDFRFEVGLQELVQRLKTKDWGYTWDNLNSLWDVNGTPPAPDA